MAPVLCRPRDHECGRGLISSDNSWVSVGLDAKQVMQIATRLGKLALYVHCSRVTLFKNAPTTDRCNFFEQTAQTKLTCVAHISGIAVLGAVLDLTHKKVGHPRRMKQMIATA